MLPVDQQDPNRGQMVLDAVAELFRMLLRVQQELVL